jgi:hypothetical protein
MVFAQLKAIKTYLFAHKFRNEKGAFFVKEEAYKIAYNNFDAKQKKVVNSYAANPIKDLNVQLELWAYLQPTLHKYKDLLNSTNTLVHKGSRPFVSQVVKKEGNKGWGYEVELLFENRPALGSIGTVYQFRFSYDSGRWGFSADHQMGKKSSSNSKPSQPHEMNAELRDMFLSIVSDLDFVEMKQLGSKTGGAKVVDMSGELDVADL